MNNIIQDYIEHKTIYSYEQLIDTLKNTSILELKEIVKGCNNCIITPANIPQYSNFDNATINLISYLRKSGNFGPDFTEVGRHYLISHRTDLAYKKYGENHSKTSYLHGLVDLQKEKSFKVYLSRLGLLVEAEPLECQKSIITKLAIGIPIIQKCIKDNVTNKEELFNILCNYLSEKTAERRLNNNWKIYINFLNNEEV